MTETKICLINENSIYYRGYDIKDLTAISSFEEVSFLLIYGELPNLMELEEYRSELSYYRYIPESLKQVLELIPVYSHPIDVLKIAFSFLSSISPESKQNDIYRIANRLIGSSTSILLYWYHFSNNGIKINTITKPNDNFSTHFLKLLNYNNNNNNKDEQPILEYVKAIDVSLILYSVDGLDNTSNSSASSSTYSARLSASTGSDIYSCIVSAIGTMKGKLLDNTGGCSSGTVLRLLSKFNSTEIANDKIMKMIKNGEKIHGFSTQIDHRTPIIKEWSKQLSTSSSSNRNNNNKDDDDKSLIKISERVEEIMFDIMKMNANVDFYNACVYSQCGIPSSLYSTISIISHLTGWISNIIEQRNQHHPQQQQLVPNLIYTGSDPIPFPPINERVYTHNFKLPLRPNL